MTVKVKVYNQNGDKTEEISLSKSVFGVKINNDLIHQVVVAQMGNKRQVLAHTKERAEVRGGGKKPWKQKGTGRARVGTNRSPIWRGGGVTFGPLKVNRFKKKINKKMNKNALLMVLSNKVFNNSLIILDKIDIEEYKTKVVNGIFTSLETKVFEQKKKEKRSILLIIDKKDKLIKKSTNNLVGVDIINLDNINIIDLLKKKNIVMIKDSVKSIEKQYKK